MKKIVLYYYYPEKFQKAPGWLRELGEILVACEQLEAYSNRQRGQDYYARPKETFVEAFRFLARMQRKGILSKPVVPRDLYLRLVQLVDKPRQFVRTDTYFGPDRRRRDDPDYKGPERRDQT